jgi:hypothetical protein
MKTMLFAGLAAATFVASAVSAHTAPPANPAGHWEWQSAPQYGPRATLTGARRVWIADPIATAARDCGDMAKSMSPADCMAMMDAATATPAEG